jgi:hypothetical protein
MADTDLQIKFSANLPELAAQAASMQATLESLGATAKEVGSLLSSMPGPTNAAREAQKFQRQWDQSVGSVTRSFARGLVQMGEGTKSFGQVMASVGNQILMKFADVAARDVSNWLLAEASKTAATTAGSNTRATIETMASQRSRGISMLSAEQTIFNEAAKAAASAYASVASIPLVGWLIAPGAAAAAFAAVEAYGNLASAAGGYDIPAGLNPLVQAHAQEMILPASIANPLRAQLAAASFNGSPAIGDAPARGGDTHIHNWNLHGVMDGASLKRVLETNRSDHAAAMESLVRSRNGRGFGG